MEDFKLLTYCIYLVVIVTLTLGVSRTLFGNSLVYMQEIFKGREELSLATNKLFQMGFFLLSFGMGLWYLEIYQEVQTSVILLEILSVKVGFFTLSMGVLVFFNLYLFFRGMKVSKRNRLSNGKA